MQPLVLGYPPHGAAHIDPGYAAYLQQQGRYMAPPPNAYYAMPPQAPQAAPRQPAQMPNTTPSSGPSQVLSPTTQNGSMRDSLASPRETTSSVPTSQPSPGSAYAQYLAAAQAQRAPNGASYKSHSPFDAPSAVSKQPLSPSSGNRPVFGSIGAPSSGFGSGGAAANGRLHEGTALDIPQAANSINSNDMFVPSSWRSETAR